MLSGFATNRWFAQRYNVNLAWIFSGYGGSLDGSNVGYAVQAGAVALLKFK